jgi:hypothetical protein
MVLEETAVIFLNNINQVIFVMKKFCVFFLDKD